MASDRHTNYFVHTLLRARHWQHRPEFEQVCAWWRGRGVGFQPASFGRGVCALVGMGGAGKTAIADRFLNELQTGGSRSRKTSDGHSNGPNSDESGYDVLPPPNSVFVYSFYDDDKPDNFFRHLQIWLEGTSAPDKQKSPTQLMFDIRWHNLRDPEPTEDNNFKLDGKEYNYRASETHHVLVQLEDGILTRYPLNEGEQSNKQSHVDKQPTMTATTSPRVFISYTHDSDEHANKVLQLANRLRGDGIESHIDQYVQNPSEGWPLWMDHEIEVADFVLVVFTERYATKAKQPKRSGGRFESVLILQDLYEGGMSNDKFVPVVFNNIDAEHILKWLKPVNYYSVDANDGYELLRRRLLNDPAIVPPPVAIPVKRGPTNP